MPSTLGSQWDEELKLVSFCPVCETRYNPMEARVLGKQGETHLIHVQCRKCQNSILALVLVNHVGASSVGLVTDLTYEDVVRFRCAPCVSIDDVIDVHDLLGQLHWQEALGNHTRERLSRMVRKQARHEHSSAR